MTETKIKDIISSCAVFSPSSPETISALLLCKRRNFSAGETIYSTDSFEKSLGIVLSGKVEILGAAEGKNVRLNTIGAGGLFGAAALFGAKNKYVSTVSARSDAEVIFVGEQDMIKILSSDVAVMLAYAAFLSDKIRFLNEKITAFTAKSADSAVARYLLENGGDTVKINMSRLSRLLDIGRTSLYRSIENLTALGAISYSDCVVKIISRNALERVGETLTERGTK